MTWDEELEFDMKQSERKKRNEEREDTMSYLEFLEKKNEEVYNLSHRDKSNSTQDVAEYIMQRVERRVRIESKDDSEQGEYRSDLRRVKWAAEKLEGYPRKESDKQKRAHINEFRNEFALWVGEIINEHRRLVEKDKSVE